MRPLTVVLSLVLALGATTEVRADQWVSPSKVTLSSPNQRWVGVIIPATDGRSGAKLTFGPATGPTTTITLQTKWAPVDAVLFDDGTLLTLDHWHQLGYGKVAQLYERDGTVRWSKTLVELVGQATVDAADHSVSSIWWRKTPLEWSLAKDGKSGRITLFDENQLELRLADGSATIVAVTTLPDDPQRRLNRARALFKQDGQETATLNLLTQMLAKDPENYEAAYLYLQVAHKVNDHPLAVAMLDKISPAWKRTDGGYALANVTVLWATSLIAVARLPDAERVLRKGAAAAPSYPNPTLALAGLLYDHQREADGDRAIADFVATAIKVPMIDGYGLLAVADFYRQRKAPAKALAVSLKGYKQTEVTNVFLYRGLAQLYEELGKVADAIRISEQLRADYVRRGAGYEQDLELIDAELVRLRAKR